MSGYIRWRKRKRTIKFNGKTEPRRLYDNTNKITLYIRLRYFQTFVKCVTSQYEVTTYVIFEMAVLITWSNLMSLREIKQLYFTTAIEFCFIENFKWIGLNESHRVQYTHNSVSITGTTSRFISPPYTHCSNCVSELVIFRMFIRSSAIECGRT